MCLAIPARVVSVGDNRVAEVDTHGVTRTVSLDLVPEAEAGSWVLVHAGYAIQAIDEAFAAESWELIKELDDAMCGEDAELVAATGAADAAVPASADAETAQ
jgi:hydrogenase expression/formation protein HypC